MGGRTASAVMELMPKKIDKKKVLYESFKVGETKMHIITSRRRQMRPLRSREAF
ncbi:MAG: hypothetical protein MR330_02550 [Rikenellaceae bacterium]|nr:hypothetical protein [Rikenellaceae bacterium]